MNNNIEVIGIDHGWSQMKTSNTCFNTSIKELANAPAFHDNVLEYDDRYFAVGEERLEVLDSKVENENFYLLTLVAMAKELEIRGKSEADVVLAVGLPLTRFSAERKPFIDYLSQNRDVVFGFEQKLYTIHILNVLVYPQCYAAVAGMLPAFGKKALVIDVGSWTVDSMLIVNKKPDNSKCDTQNEGLIKCMRAINRVAIQVKNRKIDEAEIQEYMKTGKTELPKDFKEIMDQQIQDFVDKVYRYQTECGYSLDMVPVYFVGGGAVVMRNFGRYQQSNIHYVLEPTTEAVTVETEDAGTAQQESTEAVTEVDSSADTKDTGKDNQSDNIASEEKTADNKQSEENKSSDSQESGKQPKDTKSEPASEQQPKPEENSKPEEKPEEKPEPKPEPQAVSYSPEKVVSLAISKCQAGGMVTTEQHLKDNLNAGKITKEEYDEYYPLDGLEDSYYSVFVNVDLNKATTTSGRALGSEEAIAKYIADMLLLESDNVFNIRYTGTTKTSGETFYEFRCYR